MKLESVVLVVCGKTYAGRSSLVAWLGRVALARAIALDPALMMYDEPFTGQDPIFDGCLGSFNQTD